MLVISRRRGESFSLDLGDGREVNIQILGHAGRATRVGIEAPKSVQILRTELALEASPIGDAIQPEEAVP